MTEFDGLGTFRTIFSWSLWEKKNPGPTPGQMRWLCDSRSPKPIEAEKKSQPQNLTKEGWMDFLDSLSGSWCRCHLESRFQRRCVSRSPRGGKVRIARGRVAVGALVGELDWMWGGEDDTLGMVEMFDRLDISCGWKLKNKHPYDKVYTTRLWIPNHRIYDDIVFDIDVWWWFMCIICI